MTHGIQDARTLIESVRDYPTITRLSHRGQIQAIEALRNALSDVIREMEARELHHFESERAMEEALAVLSAASLPLGMTEAQFNVSLMSRARIILREATK